NPPVTTTVTVEKAWKDNDNQDGIRPKTLTFTLTGTANDEEVYTDTQEVDVADDGSATYTWEDLATYCNGVEVSYEVTEAKVAGYTTEVGKLEGTVEEGFTVTVTNSHTPDTTSVTGTKTWNDDKYYEGSAAEIGDANEYETTEVTIILTGSDGKTYKVTLDGTAETIPAGNDPVGYESGAWEYTFINLPKKADGEDIEYTVSENDLAGWSGETDGEDVINTPDETKVVEDDEATLTIKKVDAATDDDTGLAGAEFTLYDDNDKVVDTFTTGGDGTVTISFEGYNTDEDVEVAKKSTYTLKETSAPEGYEASDKEYTITVDEELVSISLNADDIWEWLYNLIVGATPDFEDGVLTV
ncbi:MAG: hypothetical protein BZ138_06255, partial [Methanosphaera sp. rholeuAM270]